LSLGVSEKSLGYVLQAEQIVPFMAANASKFKTLVITQFTQQEKGILRRVYLPRYLERKSGCRPQGVFIPECSMKTG